MKTFFKFILVTLLIHSVALAATTKNNAQSLDRMVAVVNDAVITQSELNHQMEIIRQQTQVALPSEEIFRKQVLEQMINKKLQLQIADQVGIQISEEEHNKAIEQIAKQNNVTTAELYKKIQSQGLKKEDYRREILEQMTLQKVEQQEVGAKISINPEEVKNFIHSKTWQAFNTKEYHLEDILIALPEAPSPQDVIEAKQRAEELAQKIHQGMNFKMAAISESGNANALQGGDLGWRKLPEIPAVFSEQIVHMKSDDVAGPISAPGGFHLIHLVAVRDTVHGKGEAERKQVEQYLYQRKFEEALQNWVTRLRGSAFVNTTAEG